MSAQVTDADATLAPQKRSSIVFSCISLAFRNAPRPSRTLGTGFSQPTYRRTCEENAGYERDAVE